jgi:uncharacterized membrane protein
MSSHTHDRLEQLRQRARQRREHKPNLDGSNGWGGRAADAVTNLVGSWNFILVQSTLLLAWLGFNILSSDRVDPYPFILLNLLLSFQAAYTAPIIMMSQNRQSNIDRQRSIEDFDVNCKAELEIETLHQKIDLLREQEIARLTVAVERLTALLEEKR